MSGGFITPPVGWHTDTEQASALAAKANQVTQFGGARAMATAQVHLPPKPGVALFVTAVAAKVTSERDAAARVAVDELHATSRRAAMAGSGIVEDSWQERVDAIANQIEATLSWRDREAGTASSARIVIAGDAEHLIAVTAECVTGDGADLELVKACNHALWTIDPGIAADKRVALALAPPGARPEPTAHAAPRITEGPRTPAAPITLPQQPDSIDRRPVYVGAGIVVLAAVFWWNRRQRARLDKETHHDG